MEELLTTILSFFVVAFVGWYFGKERVLSKRTTEELSTILIKYVMPITIFKSFVRPFDFNEFKILIFIFALSICILFMHIFMAKILFGDENPIDSYATIFNNKGFIGIPLVTAVFGVEAVFFVTPTIVMSNIFVWTYGANLLGVNKKGITLKKVIFNPSTMAFLAGMFLYILRIDLPLFVDNAVNLITNINTPLSMLLLGYFLCSESVKNIFTNFNAWKTSFVRLILLPIIVVLLVKFIPIGSVQFKMVMAVAWACPVAMNLSMQTSMAGKDTYYSAQITSLSTILSVITMPVILKFAEYILI